MAFVNQPITRRSILGLGVGMAAFGLAACGRAEAPGAETTIPEVANPSYDLAAGIVTLSNGVEMPITGIGTYALSPDEAAESVYWCIECGGRLIDTAAAYNNEEGVGRGIAQAISDGLCSREDLFVTTKLWQDGYSEQGVDGALGRLGLDYVDLLFVHQAMGDYRHGYEVVLAAQEAGKARCVGLSNHTDAQFAEVVDAFGMAPQVAQYEGHLHLQRHAAQGFVAQYGTQLEDWFPLGGKGNTATFLGDETVVAIARELGVSPAQVIERWHLQEGRVIMPGSHNRDHIRENMDVFGFALDGDQMARLRALDTNSAYFGMVGVMSDETLEAFGDYVFEA